MDVRAHSWLVVTAQHSAGAFMVKTHAWPNVGAGHSAIRGAVSYADVACYIAR